MHCWHTRLMFTNGVLPPVCQVMFSSGLMLSSFKGMDNRREGVMRQIQETHRQTLIQELKRVIEQKDAFMSSVSHELRTPLNGIIGEMVTQSNAALVPELLSLQHLHCSLNSLIACTAGSNKKACCRQPSCLLLHNLQASLRACCQAAVAY